MGLRGPKPVDKEGLELEAEHWAHFFYILRDGLPGRIQRVKWGPWQNTGPSKWTGVPSGRATVMLPEHTDYRTSQTIGPAITFAAESVAKDLLQQEHQRMMSEKREPITPIKAGYELAIFPPVMPKPDVWKRLEKARTTSQIKDAVQGIQDLSEEFWSATSWHGNAAGALAQYAGEILKAKRLPHYPRTFRGRSADKRIVFWAKVMAGATLGLAPITAVKRLAKWHEQKDWFASFIAELEQLPGPIDYYQDHQVQQERNELGTHEITGRQLAKNR